MVIFAPFYEFFEKAFGIFENHFSMVFQTLFDKGGYNEMGLILLIIPLVFLLLVYFICKYPYGTIWHWLLSFRIIAITV